MAVRDTVLLFLQTSLLQRQGQGQASRLGASLLSQGGLSFTSVVWAICPKDSVTTSLQPEAVAQRGKVTCPKWPSSEGRIRSESRPSVALMGLTP